MQLSSKKLVGEFSYYQDGSRNNPVSYLYAHDLNNDGVDEVLFVAFETQPNTPEKYSNTYVRIFGWQEGNFKDVTQQWLPGESSQVEGVGDVAFGDFNGDGLEDVFLSAYTDMEHPVNAYVLYNSGHGFNKISLGLQTWQHSVRSADINRDGYDDVIPVGYADMPRYMGSAGGLLMLKGFNGGSGLALGDFLNDEDAGVVFVDAGQGLNDTYLYTFDFSIPTFVSAELVSQLPGPRLESIEPTSSSHDIRAVPFDFDDDGWLDVLVISYAYGAGPGQEHRSEVQFLQNKGRGVFEDVTSTYRFGFDVSGLGSYTPQLIDINWDGRLDLFLSMPDWLPHYNSTSLLLQQQDHTYVDTARTTWTQSIEGGGGQGVIAKGPADMLHLVSEGAWDSTGVTHVYLQEISFAEREAPESLSGTRAADKILGLGGNDLLEGLGGDDELNGGLGRDCAIWRRELTDYVVTRDSNAWRVTDKSGLDGADTLLQIERFMFSDTSLAVDLDGNAGTVAKILGAVFGKSSVANKEYVGIGLHFLDDLNYSFNDLMQLAINVRLGTDTTAAQVVDLLYTNVVGLAPDAATRKSFTDLLDNHTFTVASLGVLAAETELNKANINLVGLTQTGLEYLPLGG